MITMLQNPSLVVNKECEKLHYVYRGPIRNGCIILEDDFLIPKEPHGRKLSHSKHRIVPRNLRNIISIAFHANPAGTHFNTSRTLAHIRI